MQPLRLKGPRQEFQGTENKRSFRAVVLGGLPLWRCGVSLGFPILARLAGRQALGLLLYLSPPRSALFVGTGDQTQVFGLTQKRFTSSAISPALQSALQSEMEQAGFATTG